MKLPYIPHTFFEQLLFQATGKEHVIQSIQSVSGGCINQTAWLSTSLGRFFVKWNEQQDLGFFEAEANGLDLLSGNSSLKIPEVIGLGEVNGTSYLLLEYVASSTKKRDYWEALGEGLAHLHQNSQQYFGLSEDNYIGSLPQSNRKHKNWLDFFIEQRIKPQFGLAYYNGLIDKKLLEKVPILREKLEGFFPSEPPALLHGDLWSGNVMVSAEGNPCLIDPAVYYGHREMELAFTKLFGGFPSEFYQAYQQAFPISSGFDERVAIYNIYPLMVHTNLFGTSYLSGIIKVLNKLGIS